MSGLTERIANGELTKQDVARMGALMLIANRDPAAFDDPDRLDLHRHHVDRRDPVQARRFRLRRVRAAGHVVTPLSSFGSPFSVTEAVFSPDARSTAWTCLVPGSDT